MLQHRIADWDAAYANAVNIVGGDTYSAAWQQAAQLFRDELTRQGRAVLGHAYGAQPRQRLDLFRPETAPRGLMVFVHGGYWSALDETYWSHLARGAVERGFAVAMPAYRLCPQVRIADIVGDIAAAVAGAAALAEGQIRLCGHSAGGHLVTRMICAPSPLPPTVLDRIRHTVSISGLHDLRPLMRTAMNATLRIDADEARAESPALLSPISGASVTCWVGGGERAEFRRQSVLLANIWIGLGARTCVVEEPDRHHFNVIDGLADPTHPLTDALLS
jgi:acetyl esterase/lipase